ncbi:hypothetical protein EHS25_009034 [Saitozyma podzolica]|uniref:Uncharacterized protein n=1 Tax=Saitozyma podzolica TaxID=1890683 RepID=A0A427YKN9_9TREE|nr:hypothetical protein EHS25_009034 [Saitozyma podzolica]
MPWSSLEDALLLQLFESHGPKWTVIAEHLPGRSAISCRNRSRKYHNHSTQERAGHSSVAESDPLGIHSSPETEQSASGATDIIMAVDATEPFDISKLQSSAPEQNHLDAFTFDYTLDSTFDLNFAGIDLPNQGSATESNGQQSQLPSGYTHNGTSERQQHTMPGMQTMDVDGNDALENWLETLKTAATAPATAAVADPSVVGNAANVTQLSLSPGQPIENVWNLLLALDSGQASVHVSSKFMRRLIADAARNGHDL